MSDNNDKIKSDEVGKNDLITKSSYNSNNQAPYI